ncbi:MAG: DUF4349 domain-containing protein [Candidatus Bathyarchaeota archaeon]|nr:DUF4349 domain-containing protein [Candidatus Bathyarchaeota archaeon]
MLRNKLILSITVIAIVFAAAFFVGPFLISYSPVITHRGDSASGPRIISEAPAPISASESIDYVTIQDRMIIYNGYISLETDDIDGTLNRIRSLAEGYNGYVAGTSRSMIGNQVVADITIRIPQNRFRSAIDDILTYGKVLDERTTSEDVTEQYIDLKARLKNLEILEESLADLLNRTATIEEILKVEQELARVRGDIDSLQGQLNYLERNVTMSIIKVSLREPPSPFTPPGIDWGETFETAIRGLFAVISGLIILIIVIIPLIVIIGIPAYYLQRRKRIKDQKKE